MTALTHRNCFHALAAATLLGLCSAAGASTWNYFNAAGNGSSRWYFDADTVSRVGDQVTVWVKYVNEPSTPDSDGSYSTASRTVYDCSGKTSQILASVVYDREGRFIKTFPNPGNVRPIGEGSVAEAIQRMACAPNFPREPGASGYQLVQGNDIYRHAAEYWERQKLVNVDIAPK
jgi:hypothetical protein